MSFKIGHVKVNHDQKRISFFSFKPLVNFLGGACLLTLLACGSGGSGEDSASLSLSVTDAPVDGATAVVVEFTGVEIKGSNGPAFSVDFTESRQIDLLALQGENSEPLLVDLQIEPGDYQWMRLKVNAQSNVLDSTISFEDGSVFSLTIPSGSQTGLKLNKGFTVAAGASVNFTVDFDLRKSIVNPTGQTNDYFLKPSLRIVDNTEVGSIAGTVSSDLMLNQSCVDGGASVYLYSGSDIQADDEGSATSPISSALVELNPSSGDFEFTLGFLLAADYTAALTCDAENDDPEVDDNIEFIQSINVTSQVNQTVQINFE
ncbi:DUF4382 domain-containing protein [Aliikangiella sp. IMCC44653]